MSTCGLTLLVLVTLSCLSAVVLCDAAVPALATSPLNTTAAAASSPAQTLKCEHIDDQEDPCLYILNVDDCLPPAGFFNYLRLPYCDWPDNHPAAGTLLGFWAIFLFFAVAAISEDFFCPTLESITVALKLKQHIAGVTLLAIGNGAATILTVISSIVNNGNSELAIGSMLGTTLVSSALVAGLVISSMPFKIPRRPLYRDLVFLAAATAWVLYTVFDGQITLQESVGFLVLYVVYLAIVVVGRIIYKRTKRQRAAHSQHITPAGSSGSVQVQGSSSRAFNGISVQPHANSDYDDGDEDDDAVTNRSIHRGGSSSSNSNSTERSRLLPRSNSSSSLGSVSRMPQQKTFLPPAEYAARLLAAHQQRSASPSPLPRQASYQYMADLPETSLREPSRLGEFLKAIRPVDPELWKSNGILGKISIIIKIIPVAVFKLTVPVVQEDENENVNWNRILTCLHCILSPAVAMFLANVSAFHVEVFPGAQVWMLMPAFCLPIALLVWCTSDYDTPPKYFKYFGFAGFICCIVWIYALVNEIVNAVETVARIVTISHALLGATLISWGYSVGELLATTSVAKFGFPRMALFASLSGPLLNMMLGLGIGGTVFNLSNSSVFMMDTSQNTQLILTCSFILGVCVLLSVAFPITRFQSSKIFGLVLTALYFVFLVVSIVVVLL